MNKLITQSVPLVIYICDCIRGEEVISFLEVIKSFSHVNVELTPPLFSFPHTFEKRRVS